MSSLFSKHLHLCFFKLKFPTTAAPLSPPHPNYDQLHHNPLSSSTSFLFNSFSHNDSSLDDAASSAHATSKSTDDFFSSFSDSDSWDPQPLPPPDFATIFASQRFFFSSPGRSNSIIESADTRPSNSTSPNSNTLIPRGGVRVPKYSLNPYMDFRCSMQEMIESRGLVDVRKDWDYLHQLLLCYLALNPTHTHKYIVRAFTDLVVEHLSSLPPPSSGHCQRLKNRRQSSFSGPLSN